ncbi:MAG: hypothetical protein AVDCRST_MAG22-1731 [uncultured Rubrobacteraceae bacterium]|uniref:Uncharacterized protein n=1 Tax=uncultured Rubrobacteraceae bacterium TaxID=349277 RepID=A0A6J4PEU5_9ACTN|nr:MAG: hypothetical protein AVDCRST_MAG22-1731 [uncultured Rubrobacteraceae bacterium]
MGVGNRCRCPWFGTWSRILRRASASGRSPYCDDGGRPASLKPETRCLTPQTRLSC